MDHNMRTLPDYAVQTGPRRPCVAITGGIAEGKSTALKLLAECGYKTASADEAAKEVLLIPAVRQELADALSMDSDFASADLRAKLTTGKELVEAADQILHPLIWRKLCEEDAEFFEIPLLFEKNLDLAFDESWLVWCPDEIKKKRLWERYGFEPGEEFTQVQMKREEKLLLATKNFRTDVPLLTEKAELLIAATRLFGSRKLGN